MSFSKTVQTAVVLICCLFSNSLGAALIFSSSHIKCFDVYMEASNDIIDRYQVSYVDCNKKPYNRQQSPLTAIDVEVEKENLAKTTEEMCVSLRACHEIEEAKGSLECYSQTSSENFFKSMGIRFNATAVLIELNEDNDESEKDILRCNLQAKRDFLFDSFEAFNQFLDCLDED